MTWWAWMVFGFLLLVTEIATGGFYILFFGLGALRWGWWSCSGCTSRPGCSG
jgi:membrane protein implicated in regulation of membrane protease activity